jgi:hypothetical protein
VCDVGAVVATDASVAALSTEMLEGPSVEGTPEDGAAVVGASVEESIAVVITVAAAVGALVVTSVGELLGAPEGGCEVAGRTRLGLGISTGCMKGVTMVDTGSAVTGLEVFGTALTRLSFIVGAAVVGGSVVDVFLSLVNMLEPGTGTVTGTGTGSITVAPNGAGVAGLGVAFDVVKVPATTVVVIAGRGRRVRVTTGAGVGTIDGDCDGESVGDVVGNNVDVAAVVGSGVAVEAAVGISVGAYVVDKYVGGEVGKYVGVYVGADVGSEVGSIVGVAVGVIVGEGVTGRIDFTRWGVETLVVVVVVCAVGDDGVEG